mmetsp:Transcript_42760/g.118066  ORF Transcript_42760/g.118066 Transcript_42760/m.118066 type:complete len:228 (+) Transcript_42760:1-684(+)
MSCAKCGPSRVMSTKCPTCGGKLEGFDKSGSHPTAPDIGITFDMADVACPRCSWTLFTGGMDEDAHEATCGPLPGRSSFADMLSHAAEEATYDRPPFDIAPCPIPQIGDPGGPDLAGAPSASKLFKFAFNADSDFSEDGLLKEDALSKAMADANVPSSINQPPGSVEDTVKALANNLARKARTTGGEEAESFNQFSGTFIVEVLTRDWPRGATFLHDGSLSGRPHAP